MLSRTVLPVFKVTHERNCVKMCLESGLNRRPLPLQGSALPTELSKRLLRGFARFIGVYQVLYFSGSRDPKEAGRGRSGSRGELIDNRLEVLLVEVEREREDDNPDDYLDDKAEPLMTPDSVEHLMVILGKSFYLVELAFQFRIHANKYNR